MKSSIAATTLLSVLASAKNCQELMIPVDVAARNGVFDVPTPQNNIEVANFILNLGQQGSNYSAETLQSYTTVSGTYNIAATYCEPDDGPAGTLQVLTHGIGFDRSYWDIPFMNFNYSYVNDAVDQYGYSTFAWDRLGIGQSEHGEPVNEIQALLEVDALRALTMMLREGKIKGIDKAYDTVVHVGHSFGSQHTYALTAMYPDISDGIGLTGFSQNGTFLPFFLYAGDFIEANNLDALSDYQDGYIAPGNPTGVQLNFFAPGDFDPKALTFAANNGQPVTVGELLTIGGEVGSINKFPGPVHIITGERDVPYCGGDCLAAPEGFDSIPAQSKQFFTDASDFKVTIIPGAGHGLNLQYSHPITYASVLNYFVNNGLGPEGAMGMQGGKGNNGGGKGKHQGGKNKNNGGKNKHHGWGKHHGGWEHHGPPKHHWGQHHGGWKHGPPEHSE